MADVVKPQDVLDFWFGLPAEAHFKKDPELDAELTQRFGAALEAAKAGELDDWCSTIQGSLALVILLDQFSRNIHRGTPEMFAGDAKALGVCEKVLASKECEALSESEICWLVMPFMHSEELHHQEKCVELCRKHGLDSNLDYAIDHADIVRRFGRFPHRNEMLGRVSTPEEAQFLEDGGFAG